jgi:hypothetical protein
MEIKRTADGFDFDTDVDAIKPNLTDEVFHKLSAAYGQRVSGVKLSGYWIVYVGEPGHKTIVSGDTRVGQRRHRKLSLALSEGLGITIYTM